MRRRLILLAAATGLVAAPPAQADHWPVAGGTASRSSSGANVDQTPIAHTWSAPDGAVRTPMVITGGGGSGSQRVAYGTGDGFVHLRMLESGAPVGPGEGIGVDNSSFDTAATFGAGIGSVGFADTSTETRHGVLYVVHNDDPAGAAAVAIARVRVDNGELVDKVAVPRSVQCGINSSPLLTPAAPSGGRLLYFTMVCPLYEYLVRVPIEGDAASPGATMGPPGFANVDGLTGTASPALAVMRDEAGTPRYHVVLARQGGLSAFDVENPLEAELPTTSTPAAITGELDDPAAIPQTPILPAAAGGGIAGAEGTGTGPSPALYVAAAPAGADTRVFRFTQEGNARTLKATGATGPVAASGAPAPGMAVSEVVTPAGLSPDGLLLVPSATNLTLLRTSDLSIAAQASGTPLPAGLGFARTVPILSGPYAFVVRDGDDDSPAEHLVLRLDGLTPLQPPGFAPQPDPVAGPVAGQPAGSHGNVVFGTARGPFAYASANARQAPRETITQLPPRACENKMTGSRRRDRITGSPAGDRILGGAGNDRLSGGGGPDCVFGQGGRDLLNGGSGDDVLEGGAGGDRLAGGPGRNQLRGGSGPDLLRGGPEADRLDSGSGNDTVVARDRAADRVVCGKGRDVAVVDRRDRVSRSCERVKKRR